MFLNYMLYKLYIATYVAYKRNSWDKKFVSTEQYYFKI